MTGWLLIRDSIGCGRRLTIVSEGPALCVWACQLGRRRVLSQGSGETRNENGEGGERGWAYG